MEDHYLLQNTADPSQWLFVYYEALWEITDLALAYGWEGWDGREDEWFFSYMPNGWVVAEGIALSLANRRPAI